MVGLLSSAAPFIACLGAHAQRKKFVSKAFVKCICELFFWSYACLNHLPRTWENTRIKKSKTLKNFNSGEKITKFVDEFIEVNYSEIRGREGKVFLEKILECKNSSFYVSKYSDRGLISGYIDKNLLEIG